ncbi:hypothetical protein BH11PSE11_BH11PSE11_20060 [soil metagenome]
MATVNKSRAHIIRQIILQQSGTTLDVSIHLWERLAVEIASIIGEVGFQTLYARSAHLVRQNHAWLTADLVVLTAGSPFANLKLNLETRDRAEASEASIALLTTFLDILAVLIGELLTASILRSAWGDDAWHIAAKELEK